MDVASHELTMAELRANRPFEPTAATASMFLYAQGSAIVCCYHDTLAIERYFTRHAEEVQLLVVDNQSEHGRGRYVASYDAGMTAIVWDLMTGEEVTRFVSFEPLTAATWMRNGNIAFGNVSGGITLFEPSTKEHFSARTLDRISITTIAPASDCRTFAIGYQNGSLLIATLQPRFTILHNLTTSRAPSPIIMLAWHASASKQRSDMLASQTRDGDLRVWSVAKSYSSDDPAKVVRILRRTENNVEGPSWMGWSKNGRIIEYSDGQTVSWDVRTKHVTYDQIPTLDSVRGLAVYGPGAKLFTLGDGATVQQFDLNTPSILMANVHHADELPPSPPVSVEEQNQSIRSDETAPTMEMHITSSDEEQAIMRTHDMLSGSDRYETSSQSSAQSGPVRGKDRANRRHASMISRAQTDITYISNTASSMRSHMQQQPQQHHLYQQPQPQQQQSSYHHNQQQIGGYRDRDLYSNSTRTFSTKSSTGTRPRGGGSRLRNEMAKKTADAKDLFKFTRARLSDMSYKLPVPNGARLTNDDLRRQMLNTIFGWSGEIGDLIRDERSRHPSGTSSRMLLSKWLGGEEDTEMFQNHAETMSESDWMLLALGGMGPQSPQSKIGRAYVQRLLGDGDVHAAVTIMMCLGDSNDAIEIYVSHRRYMEALILTCFLFPAVWERQAAIIRKWGEYSIQHGQQQLAIRCFSCTDQESTEPWASPSAMQLNFEHNQQTIPEVLSPPLSPPTNTFGSSPRSGKPSALKLITSFGSGAPKAKFFDDGGQTPIAAGITPIAESAVSPGGFDPSTAFLRPSHNSRFNTPITARPSDRFPSIGESLRDNKKKEDTEQQLAFPLPTTIQEDAANMPSPDSNILFKMQERRSGGGSSSNGPRERIPNGLKLQLQPMESGDDDAVVISPSSGSNRFHWPSRRRGPGSSVSSSVTGGSVASNAHGSRRNNNTTTTTAAASSGRSVDDYINNNNNNNSTDKAKPRQESRGRRRDPSRDRSERERSEDRGRPMDRCSSSWNKPKLSPTSPISMSPQDLEKLSARDAGTQPDAARRTPTNPSTMTTSRASSRHRGQGQDGRSTPLRIDTRGRGNAREGSAATTTTTTRSPSSPVPMKPPPHFDGSEDEEDYLKAVEDQENFRAKRSTSRVRDGGRSTSNNGRQRSQSGNGGGGANVPSAVGPIGTRIQSTERVGDLRKMKDERQRKKEAAARELEERRKSLAQRTMMSPRALNPGTTSESDILSQEDELHLDQSLLPPVPPTVGGGSSSANTSPSSSSAHQHRGMFSPRNGTGPLIGLPATPRAMRLIINPDVKQMPATKPGGGIPASLVSQQPQQQRKSASPESSPQPPEQEKPAEPELLTLLPSTVYQPPPRSMSAPIPEPLANRHASPAQVSGWGGRKLSLRGQAAAAAITASARRPSHDDGQAIATFARRPSHDDRERPSLVIKELQHLAAPPMLLPPPPPPPPPMPMYHHHHQSHKGSRSVIEVFHNNDDENAVVIERIPEPSHYVSEPQHSQYVPSQSPESGPPHTVIPRPPSASGNNNKSSGHSRGRSLGGTFDGTSISSKFSRATTRLRSQSRTRKASADASSGVQVPKGGGGDVVASPYESIPPFMVQSASSRSPVVGGYHTGLHRSEMI